MQSRVGALLREQLLVRAAFDDAPFVQDDDAVGTPDCAEAVGDHEAGAALHQARQRDLQAGLGERIDGAGGLIEHQDARIGHQGPGESDELLLAHREPAAFFGAGRMDASRKVFD